MREYHNISQGSVTIATRCLFNGVHSMSSRTKELLLIAGAVYYDPTSLNKSLLFKKCENKPSAVCDNYFLSHIRVYKQTGMGAQTGWLFSVTVKE